ncbi:hypothetical protein TNCT_99601 [Trichonephila clavata]|uniref:Uncharacterized protein n=1 Tax=Trichonephila clavata TaxID=2740835 RepID=A0A8X6M0I7_TRICU|nr:hypothetical protein TNCT_99601 [Trichonephila clavata]
MMTIWMLHCSHSRFERRRILSRIPGFVFILSVAKIPEKRYFYQSTICTLKAFMCRTERNQVEFRSGCQIIGPLHPSIVGHSHEVIDRS